MANQTRVVGYTAGGVAAACLLATPLVTKWEGLRQDPYFDQAGVRTVCIGETSNVQERRYSVAECRDLLTKSLAKHAEKALACVPASTPIEAKAAFVSLSYNIGSSAFCGSTAARRAQAGDLRGACAAISSWNKLRQWSTGKLVFSQGLANRRADERRLCELSIWRPA